METEELNYEKYLSKVEIDLATLEGQNAEAVELAEKIGINNVLLLEIANLLTETLRLQIPKPTPKFRLLAMRLVLETAGTPVQFPKGRTKNGQVRLSTQGNAGVVYLGESYQSATSTLQRFSIAANKEFLLKVTELSNLWLDADNDDEYIDLIAEIEVNE